MPTVVLIHGTGVRRRGLATLVEHVTAGFGAVRGDVSVVPYDWGSTHGASLAAGGLSLPPEGGAHRGIGDGSPAVPFAAEDADVADWAALYADPDLELALAAAAGGGAERPPGSALPEQRLQDRLAALPAPGGAAAGAWDSRLPDAAAVAELRAHPLLAPAAEVLGPDVLATVVARSLVARTVAAALASGDPVVPDGATRDAFVDRLARYLGAAPGGSERGARAWLLRRAGAVASHAVVRRRHALTQAAHPAAGDVLRYLSRGEPVRAGLRSLVGELAPPVALLGHSLGGIIALDTLITTPLPQVRLLVTVGSQGPFLYESGALPSLVHPEPLPPHVPDWLNLYDPRDLLGHLGAGLFPGRVTDAEVDSRQPFPAAHSAYWTNPHVYRLIGERLP
ncbi:hypothetical protein [Streptomyces sp. NPDC053367]|uniref:hypothetical protein n=1 Tax=Streptomyces sp. NPDC053367 TaxID=3365700 RepID=UPI0037CF6334